MFLHTSQSDSGVMRFLVPGTLFVAIGLPMWFNVKEGIGPRLIAFGFLFVAAKNFVVVGANITMTSPALDWVLSVQAVFTVIFLAIVMLGIIIWLLESERSNSIHAIQRAEYLHTHDALTGVSNRSQLVSKIPLLIDFVAPTAASQPFARLAFHALSRLMKVLASKAVIWC